MESPINNTKTDYSKLMRQGQKSEMMQEMISNRPSFLIRNGISIFFLVSLFILAICWIIRYPDIVATNARLTSINAPKEVKTKTDGKLVKLMATENEDVLQGQILGFIESRADHIEVINLSKLIDSLQKSILGNKTENISQTLYEPFQILGEMQLPYQTFMQNLISFKQYLSQGFYLKKKAMLLSDKGYLEKLRINLLEQRAIEQEDLGLADTTLKMNKILKEQNAIGGLEYRNEKSKYLTKSMSIPQMDANIVNNESGQHEKEKEILQLENDIAQQKGIFAQALNTLKAQLDDWKNKYLLIAPLSGKVAFANFFQENQQLQIGQTICFINPENSSYYAEMVIPQNNFGKVSIGQKVLLKFPAYQYQEFGTVRGNISFISKIPTDSGYLAKVVLPQGLATNYQKQVQYRDGLIAHGEIITKDVRLLQRFFSTITGQIKNSN